MGKISGGGGGGVIQLREYQRKPSRYNLRLYNLRFSTLDTGRGGDIYYRRIYTSFLSKYAARYEILFVLIIN